MTSNTRSRSKDKKHNIGFLPLKRMNGAGPYFDFLTDCGEPISPRHADFAQNAGRCIGDAAKRRKDVHAPSEKLRIVLQTQYAVPQLGHFLTDHFRIAAH